MTFLKALIYFFREASVNLLRGWKVSLLAILTITVSLFLAGVFLLISGNLRAQLELWRDDTRLVVYLKTGADAEAKARVRSRIDEAPQLIDVRAVEPDQAADRFRTAFPSLEDLLEGWGDQPLPASFEASLAWKELDAVSYATWLEKLKRDDAVEMVDDDRDWLQQLEAAVLVLEGLALVLGTILLTTAIFTISSVIRLTAFLYHDEIAVMRMVGATEFFIRGPFYVEGLLQGLTGGMLATGLLGASHRLIHDEQGESLLSVLMADRFLSWGQLLGLIALGGAAGLVGAIASLRRENLGATAETPEDWKKED
ncbi:MAG: ABC transporter permease [Acidobacteriota bacterium]